MHLAERIADDGARRRRVGERGPIGTGNVAVPDCVTPQRVQACFCGRLVDRQAMAFVERLVQQLRRLVVAAGEADRGAVQIMVRAVRRRGAQFLQNLPQFAGGQARADDRAVQVGVELPDLRAPRRRGGGCQLAPLHQRGRQRGELDRLQRQRREGIDLPPGSRRPSRGYRPAWVTNFVFR
jgi:hypothetical protein